MTDRDTSGNVQVDFVWGNMPLQPNDDRGGEGQSATLVYELDNHSIAIDGWANFPRFIPNYAGDEDSDFEFVVPDVLRKSLEEADSLISAAGGQLFAVSHNLTISYVESTGKTVRVTAYDTDYANWANTSGAALIGLQVGDEVALSVNDSNNNPVMFANPVKVTKINNDGDQSWFEFKTATEMNLDTEATGTVYAGPNITNVVTVVRPNTGPGTIQNEGRNINVRYIGD